MPRTSFKALERQGFTIGKDSYGEKSAFWPEQPCDSQPLVISKDGNGDFRVTVDCYYLGQPLNTLAKVAAISKALFGIKLEASS